MMLFGLHILPFAAFVAVGQQAMDWLAHPGVVVGLFLVVGLLVIGLSDTRRFSLTRVRAIASVCFRQSIRRRVLWITPLVILGVIVISQFQRPIDAQDALRQATMVCLFATGLLVTIVSIILACTNLPQEIENRVIYTVVTKPATRLEIIIGKVVGFAAVSFWILLIMGAFSLIYLHLLDWRARSLIAADLRAGRIEAVNRPTLEYYRDYGTLRSRVLAAPARLGVYSHVPKGPDDRWTAGGSDGLTIAEFETAPEMFPEAFLVQRTGAKPRSCKAMLRMAVEARPLAPPPATAPTSAPASYRACFAVRLANSRGETMAAAQELGDQFQQEITWNPADPVGRREFDIPLSPEAVDAWLGKDTDRRLARIVVEGLTGDAEFRVVPESVELFSPVLRKSFRPKDMLHAGQDGRYGEQVRTGRGRDQVGIYEFRGVPVRAGEAETCQFELRAGVEPDYSGATARDEKLTYVRLDFANRKTGQILDNFVVQAESNQPVYFNVPARAVAGGDFDVSLRLLRTGWLGLRRSGPGVSLKLVSSVQPFTWNLLKSLTVLWLLSLLVIIASVFCSTFLSWPIAVILTLMFLMARWTVNQVGDLAQPGLGRQIVDDMFKGSGAATSRAVSESVDVLVKGLNLACSVTPDISRYAALDEMQRGVCVSAATLLGAAEVTLLFGVPLAVLGYVFLKFKEVAR